MAFIFKPIYAYFKRFNTQNEFMKRVAVACCEQQYYFHILTIDLHAHRIWWMHPHMELIFLQFQKFAYDCTVVRWYFVEKSKMEFVTRANLLLTPHRITIASHMHNQHDYWTAILEIISIFYAQSATQFSTLCLWPTAMANQINIWIPTWSIIQCLTFLLSRISERNGRYSLLNEL